MTLWKQGIGDIVLNYQMLGYIGSCKSDARD